MMIYNDNENSLIDVLEHIECFEIIKDGKMFIIGITSKNFSPTKLKIEEIFLSSRLMPAFGVSLHDEIMKEIQVGCWLKMNFSKEIIKNGLPFTSLLFKLEQVQGFNLIRESEGKYDGRCLFLDCDEIFDLKNLISNLDY